MTLLPKVKLKALVSFPARVDGGTGIDVTRESGAYTIDLDYREFGTTSVLPVSPDSYTLVYDTVLQNYVLVPVSLLGGGGSGGIADAPVDGFTYGRNSSAWLRVPSVPEIFNYANVAAAAAATLSSLVSYVMVAGYNAPGDFGRALYKRSATEPTHAGKFQSADGAWWSIAESTLMPEMFGLIGTGSDAAAIQAAVSTSAILGVNRVYLPGVSYAPNGPITVTGNTTIEGSGKLACSVTFSGGVNGFICEGSFQSVAFRHFSLSAPGGVGITLGSASVNNAESTVEDMRIVECTICIDVINGGTMHIERNDFFQFSAVGVRISAPLNPDGGDCWIANNWFFNHSSLSGLGIGIYHLSGGGWKIFSNKILATQYGYYANFDIGNNATSSLLIHNNSIEGITQVGIAIANQSTTLGGLYNVIISNNQGGISPGGFAFIYVPGNGTRSWIDCIAITGNLIRNVNGNAAISIDSATTINVSFNTCGEAGTPAGPGIAIGSRCTNGIVSSNTVTVYASKVVNAGINVTSVNNGP